MAEGYNPIDSETYYQNVQRGIPSTLLENTFSRDGYSFKGWYENTDFTMDFASVLHMVFHISAQ